MVRFRVGKRDVVLDVGAHLGTSGGFSVLPERQTAVVATIPATTMDERVRRLHLEQVDFIKMDRF